MSEVFNPMEVRIKMKKITKEWGHYYIGNTNMKIDTSSCVVTFHSNDDDKETGTLIIKKYEPPEGNDDEDD